uniref:Alkylglycerol monooxygenase n=1 Tax=Varanus komodoensis TaxID=61221 RepID=A0A8D2LUM0_VARKO
MATAAGPEEALSLSLKLRSMFYILTPNETSFCAVQEVPDYVNKATPLFLTLILLEFVVKWGQKGHASAQDSIASLSAGVLSQLPDFQQKWNNKLD